MSTPTAARRAQEIALERIEVGGNVRELDAARIAPDGTVVGVLETKRGARLRLKGRLLGGRFEGDVSLSFSTCSGDRELDARKR